MALPCTCSPLSGRPRARNGLPSVKMEEGPALRMLSSVRPAPSQKWPAIGGNGGGPCPRLLSSLRPAPSQKWPAIGGNGGEPCPAPALLSQAGPKLKMACHRWKWRRAVFCACSPLSGRPRARNGLPSVEMEEGPALRHLSSLRSAPSQKWPAIGGNGGGPCLKPALPSQAGPKPEMACHRWK